MTTNIIYGAGVYGEIFLKELESNNINIDYIIDEYTKKESICNKDIKRLKEVSIKDAIIYISITSPMAEVKVITLLKELGCEKIFSFTQTLNLFPKLIENCVNYTKTWYSEDINKMINTKKISELKLLLSDKKSINLLDKIVRFRKYLKAEDYPLADLEAQYFPSDIDLFSHLSKIRFVDGGAFIGDTIPESIKGFHNANKEIDYIASFEPDKSNIFKLSEEIEKQKAKYNDINFFLFSSGLWSENTILEFSNDCGSASSIVNTINTNTIHIQVVSLDQILIGSNPNYIKMDIEGAEKNAIEGMSKIITSQSPVLAICLYHKPEDLWELPLLINKLNKNYNMYLRIYGSMGLELVLYCVPKD